MHSERLSAFRHLPDVNSHSPLKDSCAAMERIKNCAEKSATASLVSFLIE
jgi:hypothetical protein